MNERKQRLEAVFHAALELDSADARARCLSEACVGDPELRREVEALLSASAAAEAVFQAGRDACCGDDPLPATVLTEKPGDRIGRYKLLERIAEGGMGVVYMAEQEEPVRRRVALKIIKLGMDTKQVVARFEAERQALALMDHPNIAKVLDGGATETGRPYFVMELVPGVPITEFCDQNHFSAEQRIKLFIPVCQAIQSAHQKGVIHRDIKPTNVLVTLHAGLPHPMVIDFGVAKATSQKLTEKTLFTNFATMIGTPAYMSPEQAEMSRLDVDTRSDIYSLGVLLYELLTGTTPFSEKRLRSVAYREMQRIIVEEEPERPSTRLRKTTGALSATAPTKSALRIPHSAIDPDLDWIVMKCLEKDRARRYETASGLARDIEHHLTNEPVVARPPSTAYRFQKLVRRNRLTFAAAGAVAVALLIGLGVSTWLFLKEKESRRRADAQAEKSEQVSQFLKDMLKGVAPAVALGRDVTLLREILDQTAERVGNDLKHQPEVEAELLSTIGVTYSELGDSQKAIEIHREALRLRRALFGETNAWVAASLGELGYAFEMHSDIPEAESAMRQALAIRRLLLGNHHPDTARSIAALAGLLLTDAQNRNRNLGPAETLQREALAVQTNLFSEGNDDVFLSLNNLGTIVLRQNRLTEAEVIHQEALKLSRKLHGPEHPDVATSLTRLGRVLVRQNKLSEAEPWLRDGYLMRRKFLGNDHPYVSSSLDSYARTLNLQAKFAEAEAVLRENRQQRSTRPPQGPLDDMAIALFGQGKLTEAENAAREALASRQASVLKPADDPNPGGPNEAAWFLATCSEVAFRDGPRAVPLAEKAVAATNRKAPNFLDTLAAAYAEVGQFEKAVKVQAEAIDLLPDKNEKADYTARLRLYAADKPYREVLFAGGAASTLAGIASRLLEQGKGEPAESFARQSLALRERYFPDHWTTFHSRSLLGGSLLVQQKFAAAEPLLLSGYEGMKQREDTLPTAGQVRLKETLEQLVQLYEAAGKPAAAAEWRQRLKQYENPKQ